MRVYKAICKKKTLKNVTDFCWALLLTIRVSLGAGLSRASEADTCLQENVTNISNVLISCNFINLYPIHNFLYFDSPCYEHRCGNATLFLISYLE